MAITPVNPLDDVTIRGRIRARGISRSDMSDDDLYTIIEDALDEYTFYKPNLKITSTSTCITTVANQPNYSKPTGALWVVSVAWNPDFTSDLDDVYENLLVESLHGDSPIVLDIYHQKLAKLHELYGGHWKIVDDDIWLIPTPSSSGTKVAVFYASERTLQEVGEIADRRFMDLVYYMALESIATQKTIGGGWRAGAYATNEGVGRETSKAAMRGLDRTRAAIANSYTGRRSG